MFEFGLTTRKSRRDSEGRKSPPSQSVVRKIVSAKVRPTPVLLFVPNIVEYGDGAVNPEPSCRLPPLDRPARPDPISRPLSVRTALTSAIAQGRDHPGKLSVGTMHLAKGLEFRSVAVIACDDEIIPPQERIENVADDADLEVVYDTERHLLYVACTRARDHLLVTGVKPASEFLDDLLN
jgi:hypothetical protein